MAEPTLADVLSAVEALRTEMEANTASILSDMSKQFAPMLRGIEQLRDQAFVDFSRTERLERMVGGQNDLAGAIAPLVRQVANLADRVMKLELGRS